jgi:hypothetical protein
MLGSHLFVDGAKPVILRFGFNQLAEMISWILI